MNETGLVAEVFFTAFFDVFFFFRSFCKVVKDTDTVGARGFVCLIIICPPYYILAFCTSLFLTMLVSLFRLNFSGPESKNPPIFYSGGNPYLGTTPHPGFQ